MSHVHAETIIELAQDLSKDVQVRQRYVGGDWIDLPFIEDKMAWIATLDAGMETRIKPQPKAIGWTCVYKTGAAGSPFESKEKALEYCINTPICLLEVREDGTAHLHKVEA